MTVRLDQSDLLEQQVGREIVARGSDKRCEVSDRKGRCLQVLPDAALADGVANGLVENAVPREVLSAQTGGDLDEKEDLANARRWQHDPVVDREQRLVTGEVDDVGGDLRTFVGQLAEGLETASEDASTILVNVLAGVP